MTKHTKTDGPPAGDGDTAANAAAPALLAERAASRNERMASDKIKCNACPVLCQISRGKAGACGHLMTSTMLLSSRFLLSALSIDARTEGGPLHSTYVLALYIYDQSFRFVWCCAYLHTPRCWARAQATAAPHTP